jgi:oligosaccharide repeat unit polymerase
VSLSDVRGTAYFMSRASHMSLTAAAYVVGALVICGGVLLFDETKLTLLVLGVVSLLIASVPFLIGNRKDLLAPINFVALFTFLGTTLRTAYLALINDPDIKAWVLLGKPISFLFSGYFLVIPGLAFLVLGYLLAKHINVFPKGHVRTCDVPWPKKRVAFLILWFATISLVSTLLFMRAMDIHYTSLLEFAVKRRFEIQGSSTFGQAALGYHRWGAELIRWSFLLYLFWFAKSGRQICSLAGLGLALTFISTLFFPFMTSSRTGMLEPLIGGVIIWHYTRQRIRIRVIAGSLIFCTIVIAGIASLRTRPASSTEFFSSASPLVAMAVVVGTPKFIDITKPAHAFEAIPSQIPYEYGKTLVTWLFAPIPRTSWPEKPIISSGQAFGEEIYQYGVDQATGIPPGLIPELYWNFGLPGVIIGMFLIGFSLRVTYNAFILRGGQSLTSMILYAALVTNIYNLFQNTFSAFVIEIIKAFFIVAMIHFITGIKRISIMKSS